MPFSEVYGMSENTGGMTWSPFEGIPGRVGVPWPGAEVRLGDDGEVLCRGGIVSRGYFKDEQRTAETFDADGWLHTGDIGEFDESGQLRIVDRKKELIITAGGKNVSPANLEARLKSIPLVGQAAVVGDNRPYLVAVLVLDPDRTPAWATAHGIDGKTLAELAADPAVLAEVDRGVAAANEHFSHAEQVKKWAVLGEEWLPDSATAHGDDEAQASWRARRPRPGDRRPVRGGRSTDLLTGPWGANEQDPARRWSIRRETHTGGRLSPPRESVPYPYGPSPRPLEMVFRHRTVRLLTLVKEGLCRPTHP